MELYQSGWGWPIPNDLDLGWIHMHPSFINNVSQILNLGHAKSAFLQIGTQLVFGEPVGCGGGVLRNFG